MNTATATQTATCKRCYATLTSAKSIARGRGDHCEREYRREQAVKAAGFKPAAIEKARQLIADKAIVAIRGRRIFQVVASNGTDTYKVAAQGCTCPAGIKGRSVCYHRVAAHMLAA